MDEWHPISTAPTDETTILGWVPTYYQGKGGHVVMLWIKLEGRGKSCWFAGAWPVEPSHWMPLPDGPQ